MIRVILMVGKVLKISANDVNGNVDERKIAVFSAFKHTKYMNNYAIFAFLGEYDKNKLCYGSVHLKKDSLVVFEVKDNIRTYIEEFISEYENDKVSNFSILDISKMEKIELVSYNEMDYDKLQMLDDKSIYKEEKVIEEEKSIDTKTMILYILLVLMILLLVFITIVYLYPDKFFTGNEELLCTNKIYDKKLEMYYDIERNIKFDNKSKLESIDVLVVYTFLDNVMYDEFKNNDKHLEYFNNVDTYKYVDENLQLRLVYKEDSVIDDYEEMLSYLNKEGYSCELIDE